jgi:uncharacterized protein (TIGR02217 family)
MSSAQFPALAGLGWSVKRAPLWRSRVQESVSGKRTRIADWSFPRWQWELSFDFLRQAGANQQSPGFAGGAFAEFSQLAGFFNSRQGRFDPFLYTDPDDNLVVGQGIGIGDGMTQSFPLVRSFGGFVEPILAPNSVTQVTIAGVAAVGFTFTNWGAAAPGIITFATPPAALAPIAASFSYFFPATFSDDRMDFEKFMAALYAARSVRFESVK